MKLSRSVLIAPDSWRFSLLEIQSPFRGLGLRAKLQKKKIQCGSVSSPGQGGSFLGHIRAHGVARTRCCPLAVQNQPISEFWVFSETDSAVWFPELSSPTSAGSVESYPWYSLGIFWLCRGFSCFDSPVESISNLLCPSAGLVLRDSSCQSSEVGLGDFSGLWFARMKKSPCRSGGIYSRKW